MFVFTKEMGSILRQIRVQAGLSQSEVASRMGIKSKSGHSFIAQLESGRIKNPTLRTVFDYLQSCGVAMSDFMVKVEAIEFQNRLKRIISQLNLSEGKAKKKIERDVAWFVAGIKYPRRLTQKPLSTEKQDAMAVAFAHYRINIERVEAEIHKLLCHLAPGTHTFPFYKDCARAFFSILVKYYDKNQKCWNEKLAKIIDEAVKNGLSKDILLKIKERVIALYKQESQTQRQR